MGGITIPVELVEASPLTIDVVDATGRVVAVLMQQEVVQGRHLVRWDGSGKAAGMYWIRAQASNSVVTRAVMLR